MAGNGWCTHPKRQVSSDVRILVRKGELACRNSWGGDLWTSADAVTTSSTPQPAIQDSLFIANGHTDDQVTSVRASGDHDAGSDRVVFADPSFGAYEREDVIVDHATVLPDDARQDKRSGSPGHPADDDGLNIPAQEDQHERARIIARGSRDAILRARERHTQRRRGSDRVQPPMQEETEPTAADASSSREPVSYPQSDSSSPERRPEVMDQPTAASTTLRFGRRARLQDASQENPPQIAPGQSMSVGFTRTSPNPTPPVPVDDIRSDPHNLVTRRADRERFETVPEIKPDVELPRIRRFFQAGDGPQPVDGPAISQTGDPATTPLNSYDLVLRRARAIKSAAKGDSQEQVGKPSHRIAPLPSVASVPAEYSKPQPKRAERITQLPPLDWELEPESANVALSHARLPDLDAEPVVSGRHGDDVQRYAIEDDDELELADIDDAWSEDDTYEAAPDDHDTDRHTSSSMDHSRSWWRGLSLGRSRQEPTSLNSDSDDRGYEPEYFSDDEDEFDRDDLYTGDEFDEDGLTVREPVVAAAPEFAASRRSGQRASLSTAWEPLDEMAEAPVSRQRIESHTPRKHQMPISARSRHDGDSRVISRENIGYSSPAPLVTANEPARDERRSRETAGIRATGYALDDEQGMDAFRSTLFRDDRGHQTVTATLEREPRESNRDIVEAALEEAVASPTRQPGRVRYQPLEERPRESFVARAVEPDPQDEPGYTAEFDIRKLVAEQDDLLDMTISLAPDIPRLCQTCRDFRPSESGERGWCTNNWAFTHRQMVNAESLPCQSSIGCWWLPSDASWLPAVDPAARQVPTPRTDRLVAEARSRTGTEEVESRRLYVREM